MKHSIVTSVSSVRIMLVLLVMCAVATTSCTSSTPTATFTHAPTLAPQTESVIEDFNSCTGWTAQGGQMGAAYNPPDMLVESYVQEAERGCIARLEYDIVEWSAFWIKLQGADPSPYSQLVFDIKADQQNIPKQVKIELKRANGQEVSILYVSGITTDWQTMSVNLRDFGPTGYTDPLSSYTNMQELVFTFEMAKSGKTGVIYLDNITLR